MDTLEGNKLIAEFMGYKYSNGYWRLPGREEYYGGVCEDKNFLYHSSWDWLMPVVEKIMIGAHFQIEQKACYLNSNLYRGETTIQAVYKAVIAYIEYHNRHQPVNKK